MIAKLRLFSDLHQSEIGRLIPTLRDLIINGVNDTKRVIFICGKDKSDKNSFRFKISDVLEKNTNYQLAYPEDLFEDLLEGQASNSLLSLEAQLANAVDLIILIPESPGSFAELGAFSMLKELAAKMLVLRQGKYKSDKSFINHGPIRLVKSYKGKIMDLPFDFNHSDPEHFKPVLRQIKKMIPHGRRKKSINNILLYQNHILLFIYIFDRLDVSSIYKILSLLIESKLTSQEEVGCKAAIHSLIRSLYINKTGGYFSLTAQGFEEISERYFALAKINDFRIEVMNMQM